MNSITDLTPQQLRTAADLQERILELKNELDQLLGAPAPALTPVEVSAATPVAAPKKRKLSAQAIANIRAGVRKRMAKAKAAAPKAGGPRKRKISAAGRKALAAAARARWAAVKAAGRTRL